MSAKWMVALAITSSCAALPAYAQDVDFTRFLSSSAGASGIAVMVAGLGRCDTPLTWGFANDEQTGEENPDHLYVACQFYDGEDSQELFDKTVIGKFSFLEGMPYLESLVYLP